MIEESHAQLLHIILFLPMNQKVFDPNVGYKSQKMSLQTHRWTEYIDMSNTGA